MNTIYDEDGKYFTVSDKLISFYKTKSANSQPAIYLDYGEHGERTARFNSFDYRNEVFKTLKEMVRKIESKAMLMV